MNNKTDSLPADEPVCEDMADICDMLVAAEEHGLVAEVVWSFGNDRAGGSSVKEAVAFALSEWDL
jgi:hypothetical protein